MKRFIISFFILILILNLVSSATVVQVDNSPKVPEKKGVLGTIKDFVFSPLFLGVLLLMILFIIFIIGGFFLVRWLINYFRSKQNVFYNLKQERIKLAKMQKSYASKSYFHPQKNTPIRLVKNVDGKPHISPPVAFHKGDYTTNEGNIILSVNLLGRNKLFFFPVTDLLIIPNKESITVETRDQQGKKTTQTIDGIPTADKIVQFNHNEILLHAESITHMGIFYIPVIKAQDGKIVDLSLPIYNGLKEIVLGEYMQEMTEHFVRGTRKAVDMNPTIRGNIKLGDANSGMEVNSENHGQQ